MQMIKLAAGSVVALAIFAAPVLAQQSGLVNVSVDGNNVQVPVGIAAQVCGLDVNALAADFVGTEQVACDIDAETAAEHNIGGQHGGGQNQGQQKGLVNVSIDGNNVQVPVSIAAQVCGVEVNVLARDFAGTDEVACEIDQETAAEHNIQG